MKNLFCTRPVAPSLFGTLWTKDFSKIKPLLEWNDHMGCVTATWIPALKRYLLCVTDGGESGRAPTTR